mgnify:CR=1 FL=1
MCATAEDDEVEHVRDDGGRSRRRHGAKGSWSPEAEVVWLQRIWQRGGAQVMQCLAAVRAAARAAFGAAGRT